MTIGILSSFSHDISFFTELERANIRWFLSVESNDLPADSKAEKKTTYRTLSVDGEEF